MKNTLIFLITLSLCLSETKGTGSKLDTTFKHVIRQLQELIQQSDVKTNRSLKLLCNKNRTLYEDLENITGLSETSTIILNIIKKNVKDIKDSPQFDDEMRAKILSRQKCCKKKQGCHLECYHKDLLVIYRNTTFPPMQR
ncbi:hypothetical protein Q7C36_014937 [Tachysurus vachellii]|uniref:Interleukin-21 n=1 Tax=Tachysurus vachellii TaxID=175792 RepID=A0AA88MBD3_TACVA|nr:hypothetical protein Q7C36_014937 [Tachysurus vachellii]